MSAASKVPEGSSDDPVCLLDDSDGQDEADRKMPPSATAASAPNDEYQPIEKKKRRRICSSHEPRTPNHAVNIPIKLLRTTIDEHDISQSSPHRQVLQTHTNTVRQWIGLDPPDEVNGSRQNQPKRRAIQWLVCCNYLLNFDHLMDLCPELVAIHKMVVFYGHADDSSDQWKQHMNVGPNSEKFEARKLDPSEPPRSAANPLKYKFPYGVHHTKLFLVGFEDDTLRVVIHTSNIRPADMSQYVQAAYIKDFLLKSEASQPSCSFEMDLLDYLRSYHYETSSQWKPMGPKHTLAVELMRYDFSTAQAVLIPSTPGYHGLKDCRYGYLRLGRAIRDHATTGCSDEPIVAQFSSFGSLTNKYLCDFVSGVSGLSCNDSLVGRLEIVYPTVDTIRDSFLGYAGGGCIPGRARNVQKDFLRPLLHRWRPSSSPSSNPLHKPRNSPHIKTYYQRIKQPQQKGKRRINSPKDSPLAWFCVTSHNLSTSAWGMVTKKRPSLFCRHWELGIFVSPGLLGVDELLPFENNENGIRGTIPLPYKVSPDRYDRFGDQPWAWDVQYAAPDAFGRHGCG